MFIITGIGGNDRNFKGENKMAVSNYPLDRYIDSFFGTTTSTAGTGRYRIEHSYSQSSSETAYTIEAPMVGVSKSDLKVNVVDNNLVVSAIPSVKSRFSTSFNQTWVLNEDADVNNINARLENGLLTLTIPRVKPATRTVNINIQ